MTLQDMKNFFKYLFKETLREILEFVKDVVSLRPKTLVYIFGLAFIVLWLVGYQRTALLFAFLFTIMLFYKHWIAGEWKRELRQGYKKKALEGKNEGATDTSQHEHK